MEDLLTPDVVYDASVPETRYRLEGRVPGSSRSTVTSGPGAIPGGSWSATPSRHPSGAVVDFEARWGVPGSEEACRMANFFVLDDHGRIIEHRFYCCGERDPEKVRRVDNGRA